MLDYFSRFTHSYTCTLVALSTTQLPMEKKKNKEKNHDHDRTAMRIGICTYKCTSAHMSVYFFLFECIAYQTNLLDRSFSVSVKMSFRHSLHTHFFCFSSSSFLFRSSFIAHLFFSSIDLTHTC